MQNTKLEPGGEMQNRRTPIFPLDTDHAEEWGLAA